MMMNSLSDQNADVDCSVPGLRIHICDSSQPWQLVTFSDNRQKEWVIHQSDPVLDKIFIARKIETTIVYKGKGYMIYEEENP